MIAALVAVAYTRLIYWSEDLFDAWKRVPSWVKPAIGGADAGSALALLYRLVPGLGFSGVPQVYGVGYESIEAALHGKLLIGVLLSLMLLKIVATSLTLGSGGSGGVFAPGLFIGAMLGGAFGLFDARAVPGPSGAARCAYALVGNGGDVRRVPPTPR